MIAFSKKYYGTMRDTFVQEDKSEFWVMDAKTMSPAPIARVTIPQRIPYGFHGIWVSEEDIRNQKPL